MSADPVPFSSTEAPKKLLKLDLACGQVAMEGFEGVDIAQVEGVKHVVDLMKTPWPFESDSVDEARASHYLEHLDGEQRIDFFNELFRILKDGAGALITTPYAWNNRALGDPTHKSMICDWTFLYFNKPWREANKLTHGPYERIKADFDASFPYNQLDQSLLTRSAEYQQFAAAHYINTVSDLTALVVARKKR